MFFERSGAKYHPPTEDLAAQTPKVTEIQKRRTSEKETIKNLTRDAIHV